MEPSPALSSVRPRVLIVEDNLPTARFTEAAIRNGYETTVTHTAPACVEAARAGHYDAVLVDINLGDGSGFDVLTQLRACDAYRSVPLVALTAYALPSDDQRMLEAGFDAYLAKPFTRADLLALLGRLIPHP